MALSILTVDDSALTREKIRRIIEMADIEIEALFCHQTESAFEELPENKRSDMLLRYKDWVCSALHSMID